MLWLLYIRKCDQLQYNFSHFKPDPYVFFSRSIFIVSTVQTRKYFLLTMFLHKISWNITCHFSCCGGCEWLHSLQYENIFSICLYKANNGDYETKTMVERITTEHYRYWQDHLKPVTWDRRGDLDRPGTRQMASAWLQAPNTRAWHVASPCNGHVSFVKHL